LKILPFLANFHGKHSIFLLCSPCCLLAASDFQDALCRDYVHENAKLRFCLEIWLIWSTDGLINSLLHSKTNPHGWRNGILPKHYDWGLQLSRERSHSSNRECERLMNIHICDAFVTSSLIVQLSSVATNQIQDE
jgi:hypothetical protein